MACEDTVISPKTAEHMTTAICRLILSSPLSAGNSSTLRGGPQSFGSMLAVCGGVRKPSRGSASGKFIPSSKVGDLNLEFLICVEFSDAVRKFSLKVTVVADPKSNTKEVTCGLA